MHKDKKKKPPITCKLKGFVPILLKKIETLSVCTTEITKDNAVFVHITNLILIVDFILIAAIVFVGTETLSFFGLGNHDCRNLTNTKHETIRADAKKK